MSSNVIVFAWNRSLPGREQLSAQHFQDFTQYLQSRKAAGAIESFDTVILEPNGTSFHGFFLIRAEPTKLAALTGTPEWVQHQVRGVLHLDGSAVLRGVTGAAVAERMGMWVQAIPK
ncbi:MAG TPA: hypothetical protein VEA40_06235 [Ramlibacter sp.]|nr:hypothetical protein [Ramlibacter sp.]